MKRTITGCTEKKRHRSATQANKVRQWMEEKHAPKKFTAYCCWCCGFWHVGSVEVRKNK